MKILILSGFRDFDFAKKAISIGVTDYLSKPITSERLLEAVKQVAARIENEREEASLLKTYQKEMAGKYVLERNQFFNNLLERQRSVTDLIIRGRELGLELSAPYYGIFLCKFMGENGAGKSTLIKVLTGVHEKDSGVIRLDGIDHPIENKSPEEAQRMGISTVYQEVNLCPNLSIAENIYIGREPQRHGFIDWKKMNVMASSLLEQFGITADVTVPVGHYSIALQQMVAIARAVDMGNGCGPTTEPMQ